MTQPLAVSWAVSAMCAAADRLTAVEPENQAAAFARIGETLWWVVAVDDILKQLPNGAQVRASCTKYDVTLLLGLRHARNRLTHHMDVLEFIEHEPPPQSTPADPYPPCSGTPLAQWKWARLPPAPTARAKGYGEQYDERLAGAVVHQTLVAALTCLRGEAGALGLDW